MVRKKRGRANSARVFKIAKKLYDKKGKRSAINYIRKRLGDKAADKTLADINENERKWKEEQEAAREAREKLKEEMYGEEAD